MNLQQSPRQNPTKGSIIQPLKRGRGRPKGSKRPKVDSSFNTIKTTIVFLWNKFCDSQVIINRGGARSSKSYSIAQLMIDYFFTVPNIKILVVRKTLTSLRVSTIPVIYHLLDSYGVRSRVREEKQALNIYSPTNGLIHFGGLDDPEKIKSTDWNLIWMEEATEFSYEDYIVLKTRLSAPTYLGFRNKIILSFNPIDEFHWIKTKIVDERGPDVTEIHSSYIHNPFISEDYVQILRSLQAQDHNFWRIYALGEWGRLEHIIFNNWLIDSMPPDKGEVIYGLDFGFNNPSCLTEITFDGFEAGVREMLYQTGLTNSQLKDEILKIIPAHRRGREPIYADSAEPARIKELNDAGLWVIPAEKSVTDGLDVVKRHRLHIHPDAINVLKEIRGYSYKTDKNNRVYEDPVKFNDHAMDSIRYGIYTHRQRMFGGVPDIKEL